jgi:tetratricopeptide (TPR) repeat protein
MSIMTISSYADMRTNLLIDTGFSNAEVALWTLPAGDYPFAELTFDYTNALAALDRGDLPAAREATSRAESERQRALAWQKEHPDMDDPQAAERTLILTDQLHALITAAEGKSAEAVAGLQHIAAREHALPLEFGPPSIYKPTDEMLGDLLLQMHRSSEARQAFQTALARTPGRKLVVEALARADKEISASSHSNDASRQAAAEVHNH